MGRPTSTKQLWECPNCGYRLTAPIRYTAASCVNRHGSVRQQRELFPLTLIWDVSDGLPMPE